MSRVHFTVRKHLPLPGRIAYDELVDWRGHAAWVPMTRVVQRLLREGANRQARDTLGRTPHDIAVLRGFVDVAAEFEPSRAAPSLARFLREPKG